MSKNSKLPKHFRLALDVYSQGYMAMQRLAEGSRVEYTTDIKQMLAYLQDHGIRKLEKVSQERLTSYILKLENERYAPATIRKKILVIKSFFCWLKAKKIIPSNPAAAIIPPPRTEGRIRYLSPDECKRLLSKASSPREKTILHLLLGTGITLSELCRLTLSDISDLNITTNVTPGVFGGSQVTKKATGSLRIQGRGAKGRTVPLDQVTCEEVIAFLETRPESLDTPLFLSPKEGSLSNRQFQSIVKKHMFAAGIVDANVQTLRQTYAKKQLNQGTNPKRLKELMGFKQLRSVLKYMGANKGTSSSY